MYRVLWRVTQLHSGKVELQVTVASYSGKVGGSSAATAGGKRLPVAFPHPRTPPLYTIVLESMKRKEK